MIQIISLLFSFLFFSFLFFLFSSVVFVLILGFQFVFLPCIINLHQESSIMVSSVLATHCRLNDKRGDRRRDIIENIVRMIMV